MFMVARGNPRPSPVNDSPECSLRKHQTFCNATLVFAPKWCLRKESRKWLFIQNWVVTHHQYGISALIPQTSFCGEAVVASWNILAQYSISLMILLTFLYIFSNFSHFTGVFYSSKSSLAVCGLSGHYGSWSYKLLCHQVHWSGERWLSLCRVFLMAKSYPAGKMSLLSISQT